MQSIVIIYFFYGLAFLSMGLSNKAIARHRERIMKKLIVHSRTELVKFAIRTRLIKQA